jgi:hypothetical protein
MLAWRNDLRSVWEHGLNYISLNFDFFLLKIISNIREIGWKKKFVKWKNLTMKEYFWNKQLQNQGYQHQLNN